MTLPKVLDVRPDIGCDPEFFFKQNGEIVGAEKFLSKNGLEAGVKMSKFIIDGVQAELNPKQSYCRAYLGNEIAACFKTLKKELKKKGKGFSCDFSQAIEISKKHLDELADQSKIFGCAPSKNIYKNVSGIKIDAVDPSKYLTRAAGGHIHIGKYENADVADAFAKDHERVVEMLDIICGNTCVLVDRNPANKERRKLYGKAGEYRLPEHGLEYRTLSNFWLTSYPLMSLATGLARFAVQLMSDNRIMPGTKEKCKEIFYREFTSAVKQKNVHNAINNNDFDLAAENFQAIEQMFCEAVASEAGTYPICKANMAYFYHFVSVVQEKGMGYWFPKDPVEHWTTIGECHAGGFFDFLMIDVKKDMEKTRKVSRVVFDINQIAPRVA